MDDQSEPVHVFVRIRPENEFEARIPMASPSRGAMTGNSNSPVIGRSNTSNGCCILATDDKTIRLCAPDGIYSTRKSVSAVDDKTYSFDKVFLEDSTQEEIYDYVSEQVLATVRGYNSTIFAYGVTGSGKSFTMTGNKQNPGIIPRAIGDIFRHIDQAAAESDIFFYVRLSYVELYNNSFRNLLEGVSRELNVNKSLNSTANNSSLFSEMDDLEAYEAHLGPTFAYARATSAAVLKEYPGQNFRSDKIEVRETQNAGVFLSGPNLRFPITSAVEAFQLINKGNKMRAVSATNCNDQSSRSHAILTFHVESRLMASPLVPDPSSKPEMRIGKIHLVDLAGSERLALSGAEGETLVETKNINSSLTALGDVLSALSKNATVQNNQAKAAIRASLNRSMEGSLLDKSMPTQFPVPYRNSKLTHLLKDSLGGNSKTVMITNIRKSNEYYQQTMISLMYASRAKKVRNRSTINRNVIGDSMIHTVNTEIERLKKSLEDRTREFDRLRLLHLKDSKENMVLNLRLEEMKSATEAEKKLIDQQVSQLIVSHAGHVASHKEKIAQLQQALQDELTTSQNRVAEQEQEIKWLKKALDESNQFASQDQVQKLQHAIDVWQDQAKTAHHELTVVLGQAEELKTLNTTLQGKIKDLELSKKQLSEELNERSNECADLTDKLYKTMKEKDAIKAEQEAAQHAYEEARAALRDQIQVIKERDHVLGDSSALIESLRAELATANDRLRIDGNDLRTQNHSLSAKVSDLEREKVDLAAKLNTALRSLEKKSQQMIEDANSKLSEHDQRAADAEASNRRLREEMDRLRNDYQELKSIHEGKMAQKDRALEEMCKQYEQEHRVVSEQVAHVLAIEGENESLKDKIAKLQLKIKDKAEAHTKTLEDLQTAIVKLEGELKESRHAKEEERASMMNEFEKILQEKRVLHKTELQGLHEQFDRSLSSKDLDMKLLAEKHERDLKEKEIQFQSRLRDAEIKVRQAIASEMDDGVVKLTEKHRHEIAHLKETHAQELQEAHTAMRAMLIKQKEEAITDLESKLETIHQAKLSAELEIQRQQLLRDANQRLDASVHQVKEDYEQRIAALLQAREEERKHLLDDVSKSSDTDKQRALAELERNLTKQHSELLAATQERYQQELREKEIEYQKLVHEKSSTEVKKALALERELLTLQYEDEKERALTELRTKLMIEFNANIQASRNALLEERTKTIQDIETTSSSILDEKEAVIAQLTSQMKQLSSVHRDELSKALFEQQLSMIEKSNSELERIRAEYAERELRHQSELNALYKANADDLAKQRNELENAHEQITDALRDELRQSREKLREALDMKNSSQSVEAALRMEHQQQLDELLNQKMVEARNSYENALHKIQKQHSDEIVRLRSGMEKLEAEHSHHLEEKDRQRQQDIERVRQQVQDRYAKDLQLMRQQYDDEKEQLRQDILYSKDEELKKEKAELRAQLASKAHDIQELEEKIAALNQTTIDLTIKFNRERLEAAENFKTKFAQQDKAHNEELERLETHHNKVIADMRSQQMEQLQTIREEMSTNFLKQYGEGEQMQRQKDEFYQQEISRLRKEITDLTQSRQEDTSQLQLEMHENMKTIMALNEEISANKLRWTNEKERLRLTLEDQHTMQLKQERQEHDRTMAMLKERYEQEIAKLTDHWEDSKGNHDSLVQALRTQLAENKKLSANELERLQTLLVHAQEQNEQIELNAKREKEALTSRYERDRAMLQTQHEESLVFAQQEAQDMLDRRLADQKERFERTIHTLEEELAHEKAAAAAKIHELQEELHMSARERELMLEEKIAHFDERLAQEKQQHDAHVRHLEEDFDRRQDEFEDNLHQLRTALQQEKDLAKSYQQEQEQLIDTKELVIQQLTTKQSTLKDQIADLRKENDAIQQNVLAGEEQLSAQQRAFEQEMDQIKAHHEKQLTKVQTEHASAMQELNEKHVEETRKLKRLLENEIASLKHGLEVASSEAARNIDDIERRYQAELQKKNTELDNKRTMIENLKEENIRAIEAIHGDLGSQLQEARRAAIRSKDMEIADLKHILDESENKYEMEKVAKEALQRQLRALERENQHHQQELETLRITHSDDTKQALTDLKTQHTKALELMKRNEDMKLQQLQEDHAEEMKVLQNRLDTTEAKNKEETKNLKEQLVKAEQDHAQRVQQLQQNQEAALHALQETLAQLEKEKQDCLNDIRKHEADKARLETNFLRKLDDQERSYADELQQALDDQRKDLQEEYLNSIRQQIDLVVAMIQAQAGGKASDKYIQELQSRFMDLVQDLPDLWKQRHGVSIQEKMAALPPAVPPTTTSAPQNMVPRTPIHILANASIDFDNEKTPYFENAKRGGPPKGASANNNNNNSNHASSKEVAPWSSPSLRASPTDQLIAAILDGDVQGIRAVVRSKGEDLQSEFWHDLAQSVLPIHRAISGLHFHGSEKLLIATIEVLVQLGGQIQALDHAGNSVLHKAIQVCTSKSAAAVVQCLLNRGANPRLVNKEGDTPLHAECRRVRTASVEVIEALLAAGADANLKNPHNLSLTPLTLVLLRGASTTPTGMSVIYPVEKNNAGGASGMDMFLLPNGSPNNTANPGLRYGAEDNDHHNNANTAQQPKSSSRKTWLKAAELLVKSGAHWDASWRSPHGCTQLHLLLAAFPPSREDSSSYRALLKSALDAGVNPAQEDVQGRNALFVLCEQMALTPADQAPDAPRLIHMLIDASSVRTPQQQQYGIGGSDRTGRTIFDIHETVMHSCLHACKSLLVQATSKAAAVTTASSGYRNLTNNNSNSNNNLNTNGHSNVLGAIGGAAGYDWEKERLSKVSSAMIAQMTNSNNNNSNLTSPYPTISAQALLSHNSHHNNNSNLPRSRTNSQAGTNALGINPTMNRSNSSSRATSPRAGAASKLPYYATTNNNLSSNNRTNNGYFDGAEEEEDDDQQDNDSDAYRPPHLRGATNHSRKPSSGSNMGGIAAASNMNSNSNSNSRRPSSSSATGMAPRW